MTKVRIFKKITATIKEHRDELVALAGALTAAGHTQDEVIEMVVSAVDALIDWTAIGAAAGPVGAAVGSIAEAIDGPVATALVKLLLHKRA